MRVIRTFALLVTTLALSAGLAFSQSLAEIAKKEKERRDTNKTESKTVITDRELVQSYGGLRIRRPSSTTDGDGCCLSGYSVRYLSRCCMMQSG